MIDYRTHIVLKALQFANCQHKMCARSIARELHVPKSHNARRRSASIRRLPGAFRHGHLPPNVVVAHPLSTNIQMPAAKVARFHFILGALFTHTRAQIVIYRMCVYFLPTRGEAGERAGGVNPKTSSAPAGQRTDADG